MSIAVGNKLPCQREQAYSEDPFAAVVTKGELRRSLSKIKFPQFARCFYDKLGSILSLNARLDGKAFSFFNLSGKNLQRKKFSGEEIFATWRSIVKIAKKFLPCENFLLYGSPGGRL